MSNYKLLLADDSVTIQKVVNLTFAEEGIEVITAGDGDSALEMFESVKPDIVLADVHMPGKNGYEVCEAIRGHSEVDDTPVVLLVGSFEPFDESEAKRVGSNTHLTKPFHSIRELVVTVKDLLPAAQSETVDFAEHGSQSAETADISDIESLYERSLANTAEMPDSETDVSGEFSDIGMDDEIIETSYVESEERPEVYFEDVTETEIESATLGQIESDTEKVGAEVAAAWETESFISESERADETHFEPEVTADISEDNVAPAEVNTPYGGLHDTIKMDYQPIDVPPAAPSYVKFDIEDSDILELPSLEGDQAYTFTTSDGGSGQARVIGLSSELVDAIVERLAEKLSRKY